MPLPPDFQRWFDAQGWQPHPHQLAILAAKGDHLLIAPTGAGKTLAGFLPSLIDLGAAPASGLHTIYISPLKALAADVARNLSRPIAEMGLPLRVEERTGDSSAQKRGRQRVDPPHILLTTPESLALMLSYPEAGRIFQGLRRVVLDELHALAESRRGDQLMLGLARLRHFAPQLQVTGLSATVDRPEDLATFMGGAQVIHAPAGLKADVALLPTTLPPPWAGHGGRYAVTDVLAAIAGAQSTIIFHNSRAQAELFFQALWLANDQGLPIALHHGSLATEQRHRVEAAMAAGQLRAVVATSSLDLGIDWGNVDLVIQIGSPRQIKRLAQRIGRSNHRFDSPSVARLVPVNRFEVIECLAAIEALEEGQLDGQPRPPGGLEVLCQHFQILACSAPFDADALYDEVRSTGPYRTLSRAEFDRCLEVAATGGYALRAYDRWQRLMLHEGKWQLRDPRAARVIRMNIGTIMARDMVRVRSKRAYLGEVEENFAALLQVGDTFLLGGQTLRYDRLREMTLEVTPKPTKDPKIPSYSGQSFATSLELSDRVRAILATPNLWPEAAREWLTLQARHSQLPQDNRLLCESFPHQGLHYLAIYGFAGRQAHQTLGLVLSQRLEEMGAGPMGFVASDHALLLSSVEEIHDPAAFVTLPTLTADLEGWLAQTSLIRRSFREVATIAGLIQRNQIGQRSSGKQASFSSDILFDALRRHDPDHLLLQATESAARRGLLDLDRLQEMVAQFPQPQVVILDRASPLAAPLVMQLGQVKIFGEGREMAARKMAEQLMKIAGLEGLG